MEWKTYIVKDDLGFIWAVHSVSKTYAAIRVKETSHRSVVDTHEPTEAEREKYAHQILAAESIKQAPIFISGEWPDLTR